MIKHVYIMHLKTLRKNGASNTRFSQGPSVRRGAGGELPAYRISARAIMALDISYVPFLQILPH